VIFVLAAGGYCSYAMAGLPTTVALSRDARITLYLIGAIVGRLFWLAIAILRSIGSMAVEQQQMGQYLLRATPWVDSN
jgi:hypothetical protein